MKVLIIGIVLTLSAWVWLIVASSMRESPTQFMPGQPLLDPSSNLNFVLYHALVPIAHATLGAGIALCTVRRRAANI